MCGRRDVNAVWWVDERRAFGQRVMIGSIHAEGEPAAVGRSTVLAGYRRAANPVRPTVIGQSRVELVRHTARTMRSLVKAAIAPVYFEHALSRSPSAYRS